MLEVAIIGAGSAGLVAARHCLANGLRCSIFDAASTLGGAWSSSCSSSTATAPAAKMWDGLHTNLSKHTCRFSDFPWSSSEIYPSSTPTFPSHIDMDRYLQSYAEEHRIGDYFHSNCQVTKITPLDDDDIRDAGTIGWNGYRVEWTDTSSQTQHVKEFSGVVVATGFFARPKYPPGFSPTIHDDGGSGGSSSKRCHVLHSENYKSHTDFANETVAVIGSSFSALEIAVDVSQSAKRVVSILPQIPWVLPRYVPTKDGAILPIDLAFYRRTTPAFANPEMTSLTPELCRARHERLKQQLGSRQQEILGLPKDFDKPPMVTVSDYYLDLVQDGTVEVVHGRAQGIDDKGLRVSTAVSVDDEGGKSGHADMILPNISKVICCTGFLPDLQSCLDQSILDILEYNPEDMFSPVTACWQTLHPNLNNMAFCGMYRGSYMGVVEQQARLAAMVLSGKLALSEAQYQKELDICRQIRNNKPRPQFPRFDYIGFMDSLAMAISSASEDSNNKLPRWNTAAGDFITPAFYQPDEEIARASIAEVSQELEKGKNGSRIPFIVMSALIGSWHFDRNIVHFSSNHQEHVHGVIRFSRPKLDHVLYREDGLYEISEHKSLSVFREYEYACQGDTLEIYFVEGGKRTHLFLSLKFQEETTEGYWVATSDHLCIKDLYKANFKIKLEGTKAVEIVISYRVKGPAKDYEATTIMMPHIVPRY